MPFPKNVLGLFFYVSPFTGAYRTLNLLSGDIPAILSRVRVTVRAENILAATPMNKVTANPVTTPVPNLVPNQKRMAQVMKVETLLSLIAGQARLKPVSIDAIRVRPDLSSSFMRSKISIFASTAIPIDKMNAANPPSVSVTGHNLSIAKTIIEYITNAKQANTPGSL